MSKLWIECAQLEERNGHMQRARAAYVRSVANCAGRCGWGGTRIELTRGAWAVGSCAGRAHAESPPKTCALVTLELCGNIVSLHVSCARARGSRIHAFVVRVRWFVCSSES